MVWNVDRAIGKIVAALQKKSMYDHSLLVLSADNGGPVYMSGRGGAPNNTSLSIILGLDTQLPGERQQLTLLLSAC